MIGVLIIAFNGSLNEALIQALNGALNDAWNKLWMRFERWLTFELNYELDLEWDGPGMVFWIGTWIEIELAFESWIIATSLIKYFLLELGLEFGLESYDHRGAEFGAWKNIFEKPFFGFWTILLDTNLRCNYWIY